MKKLLLTLSFLLISACGETPIPDGETKNNPPRICVDLGEIPPEGLPFPPAPTHEICPLAGQHLKAPVYGKYGCQFPENQGGWAHAGQRVGYDPANRRYRKEVNGKAWEWVYFYENPAGWAYVPGEDLVRMSDGGCAARYQNRPAEPVVPQPVVPDPNVVSPAGKGAQFAQWYLDNYNRVAARVGRTENMCSIFLTTALNMWGGAGTFVEFPLAENHVEAMINRGWNFIPAGSPRSRLLELEVGDIVSTQDERTPRDHVTDHVFLITGIIEPGRLVYATDNRGRHYQRPLSATRDYSAFWEGFRIK